MKTITQEQFEMIAERSLTCSMNRSRFAFMDGDHGISAILESTTRSSPKMEVLYINEDLAEMLKERSVENIIGKLSVMIGWMGYVMEDESSMGDNIRIKVVPPPATAERNQRVFYLIIKPLYKISYSQLAYSIYHKMSHDDLVMGVE